MVIAVNALVVPSPCPGAVAMPGLGVALALGWYEPMVARVGV